MRYVKFYQVKLHRDQPQTEQQLPIKTTKIETLSLNFQLYNIIIFFPKFERKKLSYADLHVEYIRKQYLPLNCNVFSNGNLKQHISSLQICTKYYYHHPLHDASKVFLHFYTSFLFDFASFL